MKNLTESNRRFAVSILAAVLVIGVGGVVAFKFAPGAPSVTCDVLRASEEQESRDALIASVEHQLGLHTRAMQTVLVELAGSDNAAMQDEANARLIVAEEARDAVLEPEVPTGGDAGDEPSPDPGASGDEPVLEPGEIVESANADVVAIEAQLKTLVDANDELIRRVQVAEAQVRQTRIVLLRLYAESENALGQGEQDAAAAARFADLADKQNSAAADLTDRLGEEGIVRIRVPSSNPDGLAVNLQPDEPLAAIRFGSNRGPKRQEVTLSSSAGVVGEQPARTGIDTPRAELRLPDKATYVSATSQFVSEDGDEIAPSHITVWARRLGPDVLMSVCIEPDADLAAGAYTGKAYLVDPSLTTVQVPVEVTAQFRWIDLLYLLLLVFPLLAMFYVWYTIGQSSSAEALNFDSFASWARKRFVVLYGIGFASVWAALQVAFNSPTWGSSLFKSVAVIGGGLVAAVTAMTTIAGTVRFEERAKSDKPDTG